MTELYTENDAEASAAVCRRLLTVYAVLAVLDVGLNIVIFAFRDVISGAFWINSLLTALLFAGSILFFALKYRMVRGYRTLMRDIAAGLKQRGKGVFVRWEDVPTDSRGVEYYAAIVSEKISKRADLTEHKILLEHTVPKPEISEGDTLHYVTHGNVLTAYEVEKTP